MTSETEPADTNRPDPGSMPGTGIDLAKLREHVEDLLDEALAGGALVTVEAPSSAGDEDPTDADAADELRGEELVEVTAEQLEALNAAHDALADALASLDSGRK